MNTYRRKRLACSVFLLFAAEPLLAFHDEISADDSFLNSLQGAWNMPGTFMGKAVRYHASGQRVLQGGFLRLHMVDAAPTPQYQADVFLGFDASRHDYVAHWLDQFGAAGARVVGTGERTGSKLTVTFPYPDGAFRDTFEWFKKTRAWSLLIESQNKDRTWSEFARYDLVRE